MKEAFDIEQGTVNYLNTTYAVILFFVFNIFLGMLGTFWFRTRKNRSEIALRMALGCSRMNVFGYYVLEGILLLVSAAIPAVFVCANMQMADLTVHTLMEPAWGRFLLCFVSAMLLLGIIILLGIYFPPGKRWGLSRQTRCIMNNVISLSHDQQCSYMNGVSDFGHSIFVVRCYKTVK